MGGIGRSPHAYLSIRIGLFGEPFDGVIAIVRTRLVVLAEGSFRLVTAADVLKRYYITVLGKKSRVVDESLSFLVIRSSLQQYWKPLGDGNGIPRWTVDISGQLGTVARYDHAVLAEQDDVVEAVGLS